MQVDSGHYQNDAFTNSTVRDQGCKFNAGCPSLPIGGGGIKTKHLKV